MELRPPTEPAQSIEPCCGGCIYAVDVNPREVYGSDDPVEGVFACHRYPPTAVGPAKTAGCILIAWPQVDGADWCGEFTPIPGDTPGPDPAPGPEEAFDDSLIERRW